MKWEYKSLTTSQKYDPTYQTTDSIIEGILSKLGEQRWEAIHINVNIYNTPFDETSETLVLFAVFKRPFDY